MDTDDDSTNPVILSKLLRLEWVFVHISALIGSPIANRDGGATTLTQDGIFTRCIELRYTLAEGGSHDTTAHRMRERYGFGRWGWGQGRHVAVEIDPSLERLSIRAVEVLG
eukprot:COSAG02_NODE_286_length_25649_cov_13.411272_24_plen_111_part_00